MQADAAQGAEDRRPLFEVWPALVERVPWVTLGDFPTPIERLAGAAAALGAPDAPFFIKRDDISSPVYGGNKVRTLEALFGRAKAAGARRIYSTGAFGSNHALAAVLHAPRAGLESGVILFPQPRSFSALENARVILAQRPVVRALPHWSFLPFAIAMTQLREKRESFVMVPGGATPEGALGYVSAALELARQVDAGVMPAPHTIVVGVGSTCTSAGLLVGLQAAASLGIGWREPPRLVSVRVTPWPVTSKGRIVALARKTATLLASLTGDPSLAFPSRRLASRFEVDGSQLGRGYGYATPAGMDAIRLLRDDAIELDTTYSGKSMAAALARVRAGLPGPLLYWATKSTVPLPEVREEDWRWAPRGMTRWIEKAERETERI